MKIRTGLVIILFFCLAILPLSAYTVVPVFPDSSTSFFGFSVSTHSGFLQGTAYELVFPYISSVNPYLSELIWELNTVPVMGGGFTVAFGPRIYLTAGIAAAVKKYTGKMNDYDWLYTDISEWSHWSESEIYLNKSLFLDSSLLVSFIKRNKVNISAGVGISYTLLDWSDKAYSYIHTSVYTMEPYDDGDPFHDVDGNFNGADKIDYKVWYLMPYMELLMKMSFKKAPLSFTLGVIYSPLSAAEGLDHHYGKGIYKDSGFPGQYVKTFIYFQFNVSRNFFFGLTVDFEHLFETRADTAQFTETDIFLSDSKNGAGMKYTACSFFLSFGYLF